MFEKLFLEAHKAFLENVWEAFLRWLTSFSQKLRKLLSEAWEAKPSFYHKISNLLS